MKTAVVSRRRTESRLVHCPCRCHWEACGPDPIRFNAEPLDDTAHSAAAVDDSVERKPHLGSVELFGSVGQGQHGHDDGDVDLTAIPRSRARVPLLDLILGGVSST